MKMELNIINRIILMFVIAAVIIIAGISLIVLSINGVDQNKGGKYVDCYDRYENKIVGEICYAKPMDKNEILSTRIILFISGCFFLWVGEYIIYFFISANNEEKILRGKTE